MFLDHRGRVPTCIGQKALLTNHACIRAEQYWDLLSCLAFSLQIRHSVFRTLVFVSTLSPQKRVEGVQHPREADFNPPPSRYPPRGAAWYSLTRLAPLESCVVISRKSRICRKRQKKYGYAIPYYLAAAKRGASTLGVAYNFSIAERFHQCKVLSIRKCRIRWSRSLQKSVKGSNFWIMNRYRPLTTAWGLRCNDCYGK